MLGDGDLVDAITGDNNGERLRFAEDLTGEAFAQGAPAQTNNFLRG